MSAHCQALQAAVESQAAGAGGSLGLGTFTRIILDQLRAFAVAQLDTEEERDAIKDRVLSLADAFVAPKFPFYWPLVRSAIDSLMDESLDKLPALLSQQFASAPQVTNPIA